MKLIKCLKAAWNKGMEEFRVGEWRRKKVKRLIGERH
jgi:hypothetical protein